MKKKVAIMGVGYVGLPLAIASGKRYETIGFDTNKERITSLRAGHDVTQEILPQDFSVASNLHFSSDEADLKDCNFFIITTPTPLDEANRPDLRHVISATHMVGEVLQLGGHVVYESTVYPGCTEEVCVPILEQKSALNFNKDFFCGYSPERINPGDKTRRLEDIRKITSGSTPAAARYIDDFYKTLITAGTYLARTIRVAEAAKVIENAQRDINISFVNELSIIFHKMNLDTQEVLTAANTKWNFLPFKPGLVGGHCIGVDPYYLTYKAEQLGYHPETILSGRRVNDAMGTYVATRLVKLLSKEKLPIVGARILLLGITFKENCPDTRNSRTFDIIQELKSYNTQVTIHDPQADPCTLKKMSGITLKKDPYSGTYEAILVAVAHKPFRKLDWKRLKRESAVLFDVTGSVPKRYVDERL